MTYSSQGGGGGLPIRLLIGLAIVLVGVIGYFSRTSVNPVTGEKQHISLTADQERALGLQAAPQMAAEMGGEVPASDPRSVFVKEVGQRVSSQSSARNSPYTFEYHLLKDEQTVNAFALPGGQVFITLGLYTKLPDEAALAGVLGHETGHVVGRHAAEHMAKGQLGQMLVTGVGVAGSGDQRGYQAAMVAQVINQMAQLKFSRSDESEADFLGLRFMSEAGYDPRAMLDVMRVLEDLSKGNRQPQFLLTHPYPEARYEAIKDYLSKNGGGGGSRGRGLPQ
jgi:predicted Zn-dependent protease